VTGIWKYRFLLRQRYGATTEVRVDRMTVGQKYGETERQESLRQKDRETEQQKDRKTERQKDRKTERQKDRKTKRLKD
jgi:hypothetical protein